MKRKVLYISGAYLDNSPVGDRCMHFVDYLSKNCDLTVINIIKGSFLYSRKNFVIKAINRLIGYLPLMPDKEVLFFNKYKKEVDRILSLIDFDTVIISILPVSLLLLPGLIKNKKPNMKIIVDMSDPVTGTINFSSLSLKKQKYLAELEKESAKYIDMLIVLNKELKTYYSKRSGIEKITVIEQGIDLSIVRRLNKKEKIIEQKPCKTLIYAGHFYQNGREPFELYDAIQKFSSNDVKLNLFGHFRKAFYPPRNDKFSYGGRIEKATLLHEYRQSDILVFIDNDDTLQVPGKTLEVLALKKPILYIGSERNTPAKNYMKKFEGIYYTKNRCQDIEQTIKRIISDNCFFYDRDLSEYYWDNLLGKLKKLI